MIESQSPLEGGREVEIALALTIVTTMYVKPRTEFFESITSEFRKLM